MIDTDKIMRATKNLLHGRHTNENEADDYLHLLLQVIRLREMVRFLEEDLTHDNYYVLHDKGMCDMLTRIPCYICEQEEE